MLTFVAPSYFNSTLHSQYHHHYGTYRSHYKSCLSCQITSSNNTTLNNNYNQSNKKKTRITIKSSLKSSTSSNNNRNKSDNTNNENKSPISSSSTISMTNNNDGDNNNNNKNNNDNNIDNDNTESLSWSQVEKLTTNLVTQIHKQHTEEKQNKFDLILAITRGGLVPATFIAQALELRNILSTTVIFYGDDGQQFFGMTQPTFLSFPSTNILKGRNILIVDDVWDTGMTVRAVHGRVLRAEPKMIKVATLHYKQDQQQQDVYGSKSIIQKPDFHAEITNNWVIYPWESFSPNSLRRASASTAMDVDVEIDKSSSQSTSKSTTTTSTTSSSSSSAEKNR